MLLADALQAYVRALHCRHVGRCLGWQVRTAANDNGVRP